MTVTRKMGDYSMFPVHKKVDSGTGLESALLFPHCHRALFKTSQLKVAKV
ncbi:hypothetical protein JWG39_02660 [Desulforhopalus vacuolatus]|nr:hypothetical protein [Desulforhopalus vacuolatus]MBM9518719.1 hypothetical protein [Desulforhopalus vacuolatus]